jgi:gluconolactonase
LAWARSGVLDGIHIDDAGRIWTAEYEGVVVRSARGKVLGLFNSQAFGINATIHVANFASAGDTLLVLDAQRLWSGKLAQTVINLARYELWGYRLPQHLDWGDLWHVHNASD